MKKGKIFGSLLMTLLCVVALVSCSKDDDKNEKGKNDPSQLVVTGNVKYPRRGDFLVDDKYLFEVGGKGKNFDQISDEPDSFLALDDIEVGHGNRIPLWMFGLLF